MVTYLKYAAMLMLFMLLIPTRSPEGHRWGMLAPQLSDSEGKLVKIYSRVKPMPERANKELYEVTLLSEKEGSTPIVISAERAKASSANPVEERSNCHSAALRYLFPQLGFTVNDWVRGWEESALKAIELLCAEKMEIDVTHPFGPEEMAVGDLFVFYSGADVIHMAVLTGFDAYGRPLLYQKHTQGSYSVDTIEETLNIYMVTSHIRVFSPREGLIFQTDLDRAA